MTTQKVKDSFYLERLKPTFENYYEVGLSQHATWQPYTRKKLEFVNEFELVDITFDELIYKGYHLIVVGLHSKFRTVLDLNGNPSSTYLTDSEIGGYANDVKSFSYYQTMVYEIGGAGDNEKKTNWLGQFATLYMYGGDTDMQKTISKCKKKLDLLAQLRDVRTELISISTERLSTHDPKNPYNTSVGDQVFIQAHGRLRKGKIVSTTGSRFVVGYLTPSNHIDLKYKTLRLNQLWIE